MKFDIITFGSGTLDVFLRSKGFWIKKEKKFLTEKGICFPFPSKVDLENVVLATGGGGTNTAATFAEQGFKVAYCGKIGEDLAGEKAMRELGEFGVDTRFVFKTKEKSTNCSIIFSLEGDRTCFVWRGASELLKEREIPWHDFQANWFYLAPLSGKLVNLFGPLIRFAEKNKIKIACNPGNSQIKLEKKVLKPILSKIDILILNQEEASLLTGISYQKEKEIFKKLDELIPGIAIMTKGRAGVVVSDGKYLFEAGTLPVECVDPVVKIGHVFRKAKHKERRRRSNFYYGVEKTGAGDAFASGFVTGFVKKGDISYAIQLGIANATSCIQKIGAKKGLLKKDQSWPKVKVTKKKL